MLKKHYISIALNTIILLSVYTFLAVYFDLRYLLKDTIVTGGDTASWQGIAHHMMSVLLPAGRLTGWDMGNFAGYPNFTFYFIPPFLLAVLPSYLFGLSLAITLKWAIMSGIFLFPLAAFFSLRRLDYPFPIPIIGTAASLLFLFNESYTMFGGNTLSTFAGEFCYMFAFSLFIYFIGSLYHGMKNGTGLIKNGLLLGVIGLSHLFVFIPAGFVVMYFFFSSRQVKYIVTVCLTAFGVMAFWLLPLLALRHPYTTPVYNIWQEYVNFRYAFVGMGMLLLFIGPRIALQSLALPEKKTWKWTVILLAGIAIFVAVGLTGMAIMYGSKFWQSGLSSPRLSDCQWGTTVAYAVYWGWIPTGIILSAYVMFIGYLTRNKTLLWKKFAYSTGAFLFLILIMLALNQFFLLLASSTNNSSILKKILKQGLYYVPFTVWPMAAAWLFFFSDRFRRSIINAVPTLRPERFNLFLWLIAGCLVAYFSAHFLQVPDIRFLPPILFAFVIIFTAETIGPFIAVGSRFSKICCSIMIPLFCLIIISFSAVKADNWFRDNNKGYEGFPGYTQFNEINNYLRHCYDDQFPDTLNAPRVAYEKADGYGIYGGDRVFESLPYFSGRQTLEGIHYASSIASRFIAFLQTEFSRDIKTPNNAIFSNINPEILPAHFELYNISQIIVLTDVAKQAISGSPFFSKEKDFGKLSLYRYTGNKQNYIEVPSIRPALYSGDDWVDAFYKWFKNNTTQVLFVPENYVTDPEDKKLFQGPFNSVNLSESDMKNNALNLANVKIKTHLNHLRIRFTTNRIGIPHLIKVSYFPNWKVTGANGVYPASPHFMLVIPRQAEVTLSYGYTKWDIIGIIITLTTVFICFLARLQGYMKIPFLSHINQLVIRLYDPIEKLIFRTRKFILIGIVILAVLISFGGAIQRNQTPRHFVKGNLALSKGYDLLEKGDEKKAETFFYKAIREMRPVIENRDKTDHFDVINCILYTAMCFENLKQFDRAIDYYLLIIKEFPFCRGVSEAYVKISRINRRGRGEAMTLFFENLNTGHYDFAKKNLQKAMHKMYLSLNYLDKAIQSAPSSVWAGYARNERKKEIEYLRQNRKKMTEYAGSENVDKNRIEKIWQEESKKLTPFIQ